MIMTSVLRSGGWEHESSENRDAPIARQAIVIMGEAKDLLYCRGGHFALRIRDLSKYGGALRTSCGRNVRRSSMPCLVGEHREGNCFFRFGGNAEFIGEAKLQAKRCDFAE
jgi:hypothetical protein